MKPWWWIALCVGALAGCGVEAVGTAATATGASAQAAQAGQQSAQRLQQDLNQGLQAGQQQRRDALDAAER